MGIRKLFYWTLILCTGGMSSDFVYTVLVPEVFKEPFSHECVCPCPQGQDRGKPGMYLR